MRQGRFGLFPSSFFDEKRFARLAGRLVFPKSIHTMTSSDLHVYDRKIHGSKHTSLSVLSAHIPPGARVLDLGCGSGAVGRFLTRRGDGAVIDGLTLNTEEAALAAPDYRRVEVANLDSADLAALFAGSQYDAIVYANVLMKLLKSWENLDPISAILSDFYSCLKKFAKLSRKKRFLKDMLACWFP